MVLLSLSDNIINSAIIPGYMVFVIYAKCTFSETTFVTVLYINTTKP